MKKLFYSLCAIASLFTIHSCTNDISEDFISQKKIKLTQDEVFSISYEETKDLEEKTLFDMVNAFANLQNGTTTRSNATSFIFQPIDYLSIPSPVILIDRDNFRWNRINSDSISPQFTRTSNKSH